MRYVSTRGASRGQSFSEVLLAGLATDGGLYVPKHYPQLSGKMLHTLRKCDYPTVALEVLSLFGSGIPWFDLNALLQETYTKKVFGTDEITPLKWLEPERLALLQLSNGPTLAFKDVPLQLLGRLMNYVLEKEDSTLNILGASSGDTCSAAASALAGKNRLRPMSVWIIYALGLCYAVDLGRNAPGFIFLAAITGAITAFVLQRKAKNRGA